MPYEDAVTVCESNLELQGIFKELWQNCFGEVCVFAAYTLAILRDSTQN